MQPLTHQQCKEFDAALEKKQLWRTNEGFYVTFIEWDQVPPESVDKIKAEIERLRAEQNIPPEKELKPFAIIGRCPFCGVALIEAPPDIAPYTS